MKYILYIVLILLLLAINAELASILSSFAIRINLLFLPAVFSAVENKQADSLFLAVFGGFFLDLYGAAPFGSFMLSFILAAAILNWASKTFWVYKFNLKFLFLSVLIVFVFIEVFVRVSFTFLPSTEFSKGFIGFKNFFPSIFYLALWQLVFTLPIYSLWRLLNKVFEKMESKRILLK